MNFSFRDVDLFEILTHIQRFESLREIRLSIVTPACVPCTIYKILFSTFLLSYSIPLMLCSKRKSIFNRKIDFASSESLWRCSIIWYFLRVKKRKEKYIYIYTHTYVTTVFNYVSRFISAIASIVGVERTRNGIFNEGNFMRPTEILLKNSIHRGPT